MSSRDQVLIVSRSSPSAESVRTLIRDAPDLAVDVRLLNGVDGDPLQGLPNTPDVLLLRVNGAATPELDMWTRQGAEGRPPLIVIGEAANAQCMRAAMQAGARDFLVEPVAKEDLLGAIRRVTSEQRASRKTQQCRITAFVNAKGGSGATFLACNIAHVSAVVSKMKTALLDLDLQFGTLPQYLDIDPGRGLLEALDVADDLDSVAIGGYLTQHKSGLSVLAGSPPGALLQHQDLLADRFETVLNLLVGGFERLVVDLPRQIEPLSARVLERANQIVVVLQQSVPSLHDATRMYDILTRSLAIPSDNVRFVVNRYRKNASVELSDIKQALRGKEPICFPNDFRYVSESADMGIPLYEHARRSPAAKALLQLEQDLGGTASTAPRRGFLPRVLGAG